jgi:hypothetical protein
MEPTITSVVVVALCWVFMAVDIVMRPWITVDMVVYIMVRVAGAGVAMYATYLAWWAFTRPSEGAQLVSEVDLDPEGDEPGLTTRAARMAAYAFKAEFGELRYNKANRIVAGDWVRKHFRDGGMRYVDIVRHMDIAVELCLLPTESAVTAARLARTREVAARRAVVDTPR